MNAITDIHVKLHQKSIISQGYIKSLNINKNEIMEYPIDFVVTWVDGNDSIWKKEKNKYSQNVIKKGNGEERYRDWNQFMYWFRAVEKYAPWVRKIYLITWGHIPKWLDINNNKLEVICHNEYIPQEYLPTFSSIPIELNMHRIEGLSEHFVYFNDDMFLTQPVSPSDFFENGLPKYCAVAEPLKNYGYNGVFLHQQFSVMGIINGYFNLQTCIEKNPECWFNNKISKKEIKLNELAYKNSYLPGLYFSHLGSPFRKATFEDVWKSIPNVMNETCLNRFRTPLDVMHQIFSAWEIMQGTFIPVGSDYYGKKYGEISKELDNIKKALISQKYKMICINDSIDINDKNFEKIRKDLNKTLEQVFPDKSEFEIGG